ncbi:MAG: Do family serine endopeptidase [Pseudomonadota bacterium]
MFRSISAIVILLILSSAGQAQAVLPAAVDGQPLPSLAPVLERVTPAVVNIHSRTRVKVRQPFGDDPFFRRFFGMPRERVSQSLGSGVIVDAEAGLVLTNNHVIDGATEIQVTLHDGRTFEAELVGTDAATDVGLIRIPPEDLLALPLATDFNLRVGDFVLAVGNPFGLGQTVTSGIVSALGRRGLRGLNFQNFIQTDASINPGNSGGALLNLRGELVGVNTAIFSPSGGNVGIGFAIPADIAANVMSDLVAFGAVRRGQLGVTLQALNPELAEALGMGKSASGAVITKVRKDSPAERLGLEEGDVIVALGGEAVTDPDGFRNAEGLVPVGQEVPLTVVRDGETEELTVVLEETALTEVDGSVLHPLLSGTRLRQLDGELAQRVGVEGIVFTELSRRSRAARAGLKPGDLVHRVNRKPVATIANAQEEMDPDSDSLVLSVLRGGRSYLVVIE